MICPKCGLKTKVTNTCNLDKKRRVYRERVCTHCGHRFWTAEVITKVDDDLWKELSHARWGWYKERFENSNGK